MVRPKTLSEKRAQCLSCPVYLHHQQQKYTLAAPLSILAVAVFQASLDTLFVCVGATNVVSALVYATVYGRGKWRKAVEARIE